MTVWALRIALALALGGAGFAGWVRLAPSDPARWHVDPLTAPDPVRPNFARVAPGEAVFALPPAVLAARVEALALGWPRTRRLAGAPAEGWMTYVTRSALWGFPDYTSVRVLPAGDGGASLVALARARFGHSDLGVNRARLDGWLAALAVAPGGVAP